MRPFGSELTAIFGDRLFPSCLSSPPRAVGESYEGDVWFSGRYLRSHRATCAGIPQSHGRPTMQPLDYARSFVTFETLDRRNNARIQVEARCRLWLPDAAAPRDYLLVASCRSEDTYARENLFTFPNYDFCAIFGPDDYQIIRTHATTEHGGRETGRIADRFHEVRVALRGASVPERCDDDAAIVRATLANDPLVGQTELRSANGRARALLEYPIKTMNANGEHAAWQVDSGPMLLPDWNRTRERPLDTLDLAYVAFNTPDWAEFVVRQPTAIAAGGPVVEHYSEKRVLTGRNLIFRLSVT